jgi:hypothetical protein
MKIKSEELKPGMVVVLPKGKRAKVLTVEVKDVPIPRSVKTTVISYKLDDEEDEGAIFDRHLAGSARVEVEPPSLWQVFTKWATAKNHEHIEHTGT